MAVSENCPDAIPRMPACAPVAISPVRSLTVQFAPAVAFKVEIKKRKVRRHGFIFEELHKVRTPVIDLSKTPPADPLTRWQIDLQKRAHNTGKTVEQLREEERLRGIKRRKAKQS